LALLLAVPKWQRKSPVLFSWSCLPFETGIPRMNSEPTKILSRLPLHCKFTRAGVGYSFFLFDQLVATATAIRLMDASPRAGGEQASRTQAVARVRVAGSFSHWSEGSRLGEAQPNACPQRQILQHRQVRENTSAFKDVSDPETCPHVRRP
jgi:hypothetical protein